MPGAFPATSFAARSSGGKSTVDTYVKILGRVEVWTGVPLEDASLRDLERLKAKLRTMRSGRWHAAVVRMYYRAAGEVLDDAKYAKYASFMRLKQRTRRLEEKEILTLPEVNALLGACTTLRDRALIVVLWECGMRIGDTLPVDLGDVAEVPSPENGGRTILRVFFKKVKVAGEEHSGFVLEGADHVRAWIRAYLAQDADAGEHAPLFPSRDGRRLAEGTARQHIRNLAAKAGIKKRVYPHLFRHSRATHLLRIGVPESMVKKLLGWTPGSNMLAKYSHLVNRDAYAALLRAHGIQAPQPVDLQAMLTAEQDLRPVVPIASGRAAIVRRLELEDAELAKQIVRRAFEDPAIIEELRKILAPLKR